MDDLIPQDAWDNSPVPVLRVDVVHDDDFGTIAAASLDGKIVATEVDRG